MVAGFGQEPGHQLDELAVAGAVPLAQRLVAQRADQEGEPDPGVDGGLRVERHDLQQRGDWLRATPSYLRALAWTYPVLAAPPDWPGDGPRFDCVTAVTAAPDLPKLLVRVGAEYPLFSATQQAMVDAARDAGSALDVIDLPDMPHGYEAHGHLPAARGATEKAMAWVARALSAG